MPRMNKKTATFLLVVNIVFVPTLYEKDLILLKRVHRNCPPSCMWRSLRWKFLYRRTLLHCSDMQGWNSAKTTAFLQQQQLQKNKHCSFHQNTVEVRTCRKKISYCLLLFPSHPASFHYELDSTDFKQPRGSKPSEKQTLVQTSSFNFGSLCHWLFTRSVIC